MAKFRDRVCTSCGAIEKNTATKSEVCKLCALAAKKELQRVEERKKLEQLGYLNIQGPSTDIHGHAMWTFTHKVCGTEQTWTFGNLLKRLREDSSVVPCSSCGGKRRAAIATAGFVAKYGITEEQLAEFVRYSKKVRTLSDKNFKLYETEINPHGLKRGMHTYHLDHILTIGEGFKLGFSPEFIARKENLRMLTAKENLSRGRVIT